MQSRKRNLNHFITMSADWSLKITCKLLNTAFVNINNIYIYILHLNFFSNELGSKAIIQTYKFSHHDVGENFSNS